MVPVVHIGVGHNVVVALGVDVDLVIVVVVVIDVVIDVGHDGEDVHGGGQEGHLGDVHCGGVSSCWTPEKKYDMYLKYKILIRL